MNNNLQVNPQPSALTFLVMLYITCMLTANVVIYKLIVIGGMVMSVGSFVIPFVHVILDIIAERYGYAVSKKIIFYSLTCQLIFAMVCCFLILLPSPDFWHYQAAYDQVLGKLPRVFIGSFLGTLIGLFINAKIISRWKIIIRGKYFWLRSLGASGAGQLAFSIITLTYDMYGIQPASRIISIIVASYVIKMFVTAIAVMPAAVIVAILAISEKRKNDEVVLNPFRNAKLSRDATF